MQLRTRLLLAFAIGLLSGLGCLWRLEQRDLLGMDFTFPWRAAQSLLAGENPYRAIQPGGEYPGQTYFYYPLTAALAALPFAGLPPKPAASLFFGLSSGLLAFALSRQGWARLPLFLSAPFFVSAAVAQWAPLMIAAALLPGLEWLLACKPNLGAALFFSRPSWRGLALIAAFLVLSLLVLPTWPWDWLGVSRTLQGHPPPALLLPLGPLLLLSILRWRKPEGRLLLGMSLVPQLLFFYDQLPLWLIPNRLAASLLYAGLSWIAYFAWRLRSGMALTGGGVISQPDGYVMVLVYLPALMILFWQERRELRGAGQPGEGA